MLVYATNLWLASRSGSDPFEDAAKCIERWLRLKIGAGGRDDLHFSLEQGRTFRNSRKLQITHSQRPSGGRVSAARFSHPDDEVSGRLWVTELGLQQEAESPDVVHASVLLRVDVISAQVRPEVTTTCPKVVPDLVETCQVVPPTPDCSVSRLERESAEEFAQLVENPERRHVLVLISPDGFTDRPLVDPDLLARQVAGLASVAVIANKVHTFEYTQVLGRARSAWDGAVNLLFPVNSQRPNFVPSKLLRSDELRDEWEGEWVGHQAILGQIVHLTNLPNSWRHVSPDSVRTAKFQAMLQKKPDEDPDLVELYDAEIASLKEKNEDLQNQLANRQEEVQRLEAVKSTLTFALSKKSQAVSYGAEPREARAFDDVAELIGSIESEMSQEMELTGRAKNSMKNSPYRNLSNVYAAFTILADAFHRMFIGNTDLQEVEAVVREAGIEYLPHMSEITMGNFPDYDVRYKGRKADLNKHLCIGSSHDPSRCYRIHFEWDEDAQRIVVHHAGRHLTTTRS